MLRRRLTFLYIDGGVLLVMGAAITFLFYARTADVAIAAKIGFFYSFAAVGIFRLITYITAGKLEVFPANQQWILKGILYTIGISVAYLVGLAFQTLTLNPTDTLFKTITDQLWKGFVYLVSSPIKEGSQDQWLDLKTRGITVTFFTVLFLIGIISLVFSLVEVRWRMERQNRAVERAELAALRAQMDPHFLFNTLNAIAALIKTDPTRAESLVIQLSDMLRYIFRHTGTQIVALRDELDFTRQYIALMEARYGDGLQVAWQIDAVRVTHPIPVLIIQPLIENALRHGYRDVDHPLKLQITIEETDGAVNLAIADNGRGMSPEKVESLPIDGHALANIVERLHLQYGRHDLMAVDSQPDMGTTVRIKLPV